MLVVVDDETRARHARAARVAWCHAQNLAVKIKRLVKIGGIDADVRDAGDGRSRGLVLALSGRGTNVAARANAMGFMGLP